MSRLEAEEKAQRIANESLNSVLVYQSLLSDKEYGVCFTLPLFGASVRRVYPIKISPEVQ